MLTLSPETEARVRAEAVKLGKTEDEVIRAWIERLGVPEPLSEQKIRNRDEMRKRTEEILARYRDLPVFDDRSADEILGYDENGLFK